MGLRRDSGEHHLSADIDPQVAAARAFLAKKEYPFTVEDPSTGEKLACVFRDVGHSELLDTADEKETDKKKLTYKLVSAALVSPKLTPEDLANGKASVVNQIVQQYNTLFLRPRPKSEPSTASSSSTT